MGNATEPVAGRRQRFDSNAKNVPSKKSRRQGRKRMITIDDDPVVVFPVEAGEHLPTERGRADLRRAMKLDFKELRYTIDLRGPHETCPFDARRSGARRRRPVRP
jgi:hypothetical protein